MVPASKDLQTTVVRNTAGLLGCVLTLTSFLIASGPTSTITGQFQTSTGETINYGTLSLLLSQPATVAGTATLAAQSSFCYTSEKGNVAGVPDPTLSPLLSVNTSGGLLARGTYYVKIYYTTSSGLVSAPSPEARVSLSSSGTLKVKAPAYHAYGATGYGVAISTTPGAETIQGVVAGWKEYRQSDPLVAGPAPSSTNNSKCYVYFSDQLIPIGTYYSVMLLNANGSQVDGFPKLWCPQGGAGDTMDISRRAPTENCNAGDYYPTPIVWSPNRGLEGNNSDEFDATNSFRAAASNGYLQVDGKQYRCIAAGINRAIQAVGTNDKAVFIGPGCAGTIIGSNLWSGITTPSKVVFGPGKFTFNAQQIIPSNTEIYCSGWQTTLAISASLNIPIAWASGLFTNSANPALKGNGTNTGISIHDCVIDGTGNTQVTAGITLYNASKSSIFNMYLKNIYHSGIDIRNGSHNEVRDSWCENCAQVGGPQHAFGGGTVASTDSFLHNKFVANHVFGGGVGNGGADHYDIFGQAPQGHCGFNLFIGNTSDSAPIEGIFLDTCNHNVVSENVLRNARRFGIACTSGVHNLEGGCSHNLFLNNRIYFSSQAGHYFINNANDNIITGEEIWNSGAEAIRIIDSGGNKVENVSIHLPSQASPSQHCGVTINSDKAGAYAANNQVRNNSIYDSNPKSLKDVCFTSVGGSRYVFNNLVQGNEIYGGRAGGTGKKDTQTNEKALLFHSNRTERPHKYVLNATPLQPESGIYMEVKAVRGCTTGRNAGNNCATPVTVKWPETFVDTNYSGGCNPSGSPSNHPGTPYVTSKTVRSMEVNYIATSASPARWAFLDCWAIHEGYQ